MCFGRSVWILESKTHLVSKYLSVSMAQKLGSFEMSSEVSIKNSLRFTRATASARSVWLTSRRRNASWMAAFELFAFQSVSSKRRSFISWSPIKFRMAFTNLCFTMTLSSAVKSLFLQVLKAKLFKMWLYRTKSFSFAKQIRSVLSASLNSDWRASAVPFKKLH